MSKRILLGVLAVVAVVSLCACDGDEKGYALAIGLNAVDPGHYAGWAGKLNGCEPDALNMASIASTRGLSAETLLTASATRNAVLGKLGALAGKLKSGDLLVVSYSGHGGQIPDQNGDEDDGLDETWCLYDGELLDDELNQAWSKFQSGVRILALSDSCHSGTVLKMIRPDYDPQAQAEPLKLARSQELKNTLDVLVAQKRSFFIEGVRDAMSKDASLRARVRDASPELRAKPKAREVPDEEVKAVTDQAVPRVVPWQTLMETYQQNRQFYDDLGRRVPGEKDIPVLATAILISGCQDDQTSMDLGTNGLFTMMLKQVWDDGLFNGNHMDFHSSIKAKVLAFNPNQAPFFYMIGAGNDPFIQQKPYTISLKAE